MIGVFADFHFIRVAWLLLLIPIAALWWLIRPTPKTRAQAMSGIAPHLAAALELGADNARRLYPIDVAMIAAILVTLAAAGPTWSRAPNPLVANAAPLVIALKVTDSMEEPDLAPSRLDRAKFKVTDLINARVGARTALIAYAGTPHRVAPLTEDANILRPLLEGLTPTIMPKQGDAAANALTLAETVLNDSETPGAVLFVLDDLDPSQLSGFETATMPVFFLTMLPNGHSIAQLDGLKGTTVVPFSSDDRDINRLQRHIQSAYTASLDDEDRLDWQDKGWLLAWPTAFLSLLWFRRGWVIRLILLTFCIWSPSGPAYADGWRDWFLTPDQQGQIAMNQKRYAEAAELFQDPYQEGYARLKAGQYPEAAAIFAELDTPEAAFSEGMARIRNREYRPAIASFETALERRPDWPEAQHNLEVSKAILDYVETTREQSDTGEEAGIGADDTVFDNDAGRGEQTTIQAPTDGSQAMSADQWISTIDTDMQDFLRNRFLLENQEQQQ
ncbi:MULTISPECIES: VWA domain-containing protein [unclassified Ruegeria]|uniref:VWA domain-containing protein n=1 Tax=unclassified Ruegeria TaxID=2625375 RepID=UPI001488842C|nr:MULTISPECIES: VWA domain-containing protein [unclassified Ruegeria]NOD33532.1 VWA domain-containing protein [Ruegeria sp. HKCCD7296]NOD46169.1 VWA domain-containing protein [Ruegeria sp. HKCCD5849]NOD50531.1 VWA domain-containing protein [Ruegeria sp. HKCCD5851]NOD67347.1 VWA domain-containing protein [Ruegeria sp. HKCCD7303]NOE40793.1 VWA domain-containing protein [Ruegeria sp. HKCCD7319]